MNENQRTLPAPESRILRGEEHAIEVTVYTRANEIYAKKNDVILCRHKNGSDALIVKVISNTETYTYPDEGFTDLDQGHTTTDIQNWCEFEYYNLNTGVRVPIGKGVWFSLENDIRHGQITQDLDGQPSGGNGDYDDLFMREFVGSFVLERRL